MSTSGQGADVEDASVQPIIGGRDRIVLQLLLQALTGIIAELQPLQVRKFFFEQERQSLKQKECSTIETCLSISVRYSQVSREERDSFILPSPIQFFC